MRVGRGDWTAGWIKPTWWAVWGLICAASLAVNLVLLWPRLTLLASSASQLLLISLNIIASRRPLLLSYLTPDLLSLLLARPHLYVLLNLILMRIVYRSGILSRPPPPSPAFPLCSTSHSKKQLLYAIPLSRHADHDDLLQVEDHALITHNYCSKPWRLHYPHADLTPAAFTSPDPCVDHHAVHPIDVVVDLAAKKETLQKSIGSVLEPHHHLLRMKDKRSKQQRFSCLHDEAAVAATVAPQQINNRMTIKKEKGHSKRPSLFSIEPLSNTMSDGDQLHAQPNPDKKMTRSYTINNKATSSPFSASAPAGPSFQRSASEARRSKVSAAAHYPINANYTVTIGTHRDMETKPSSLTHSSDAYYDLSKEEFNARVETFISKFHRKLSMQRQGSFNRLLGLVNGIQ